MLIVKKMLYKYYRGIKSAEVEKTSATTSAKLITIHLLINALIFSVFRASLKKQTSAPVLANNGGAFGDRCGGCGGFSGTYAYRISFFLFMSTKNKIIYIKGPFNLRNLRSGAVSLCVAGLLGCGGLRGGCKNLRKTSAEYTGKNGMGNKAKLMLDFWTKPEL